MRWRQPEAWHTWAHIISGVVLVAPVGILIWWVLDVPWYLDLVVLAVYTEASRLFLRHVVWRSSAG
jgi:hypothetical protein